jgi:hypothetical protein
MSEFRTVPVLGGTNLRLGGSTKGDVVHDNIIGPHFGVAKGRYRALVQCAGEDVEEVVGERTNTNFWWVLIETPLGTGWVSAVRIAEGGNDEPIDGVTKAATVFHGRGPASHEHKKVLIVPGGATLRWGGSTKSDPDNATGTVARGGVTYPALVQCAGEEVTIGRSIQNFWWVLINTPDGLGWVSATLIDEGGNDEPIDDVPITRTEFARPPDLIP